MKYLAENRKAYFDYEILEKYEAGLVLTGQEVKSIKSGKANLTGSFAIIRPAGAFLLNAQIPPYQAKNTTSDYDPTRTRQLLLNKKEINELLGKSHESGLTIVPLSLYNKGGRIKISIGLARYKQKHDKRETIRKRETQREIRRALKE